ncbi:hypothetical protein HC660_26880 [Bacillus mojavensis]|uniref:Uncharacterized protein n=1 Tax=Bacillus mojavensis TaxID=72360 RepID=A0ABX6LZF4_BACMO|nr:hypothetical protein [Bacillus mojavensis]QJC97162.1 hypothetical protein HC660_26880 [Bacillus mojavensis]
MFKQRLIKTVVYFVFAVIGLLLGSIVAISLAVIPVLLNIFPIVAVVVKVILTIVALLILGALTIKFINWLIVEPYRNHKRKRETEGSAE